MQEGGGDGDGSVEGATAALISQMVGLLEGTI